MILILFGANFLFVISWAVRAIEKKRMANSKDILLIEPDTKTEQRKVLKVEVFNACGEPGVARALTDYLRKYNYVDVVFYGNYRMTNLPETRIIDRSDEAMSNAKKISKLIGVKEERLYPILSPDRQLDATILIGKDYAELKAFKRKII